MLRPYEGHQGYVYGKAVAVYAREDNMGKKGEKREQKRGKKEIISKRENTKKWLNEEKPKKIQEKETRTREGGAASSPCNPSPCRGNDGVGGDGPLLQPVGDSHVHERR